MVVMLFRSFHGKAMQSFSQSALSLNTSHEQSFTLGLCVKCSYLEAKRKPRPHRAQRLECGDERSCTNRLRSQKKLCLQWVHWWYSWQLTWKLQEVALAHRDGVEAEPRSHVLYHVLRQHGGLNTHALYSVIKLCI